MPNLLEDLRFDGNDTEYSGQKVPLLDLRIHMSFVSILSLTVDRMYTTQIMTGCKLSLSTVDGCGCDNSQVGTGTKRAQRSEDSILLRRG